MTLDRATRKPPSSTKRTDRSRGSRRGLFRKAGEPGGTLDWHWQQAWRHAADPALRSHVAYRLCINAGRRRGKLEQAVRWGERALELLPTRGVLIDNLGRLALAASDRGTLARATELARAHDVETGAPPPHPPARLRAGHGPGPAGRRAR